MRRTTLILSVLAVLSAGIVFWVIFSPDDKLATNPGDAGVMPTPIAEDGETELANADSASGDGLAGEGETEAADRTELATLGGDEATAAEDPTASLTLRVVDPEDQPIEGLDVRIEEVQDNRGIPFGLGQDDEEPELYAELPSNGNGEVDLLGLPTGKDLMLVLSGDYWVERRISLASLRAGESRNLGQLSIARGVLLTGRVLGDAGVGVEGAKINLSERTGSAMPGGMMFAGMDGGLQLEAETDADGRFRMPGLPPKEYTVRSTRVGQVAAETDLVLSLSNPDHRVELRMADGGWITGVVRSEDGTPLPDAKVALIPARGFAMYQWDSERILEEGMAVNEDGSFRLTGVPDDNSHRVVAAAEGYARDRSDRVVPGMKVELGLEASVSLAGIVLDAAGQPVAEASIIASRTGEPSGRNREFMAQSDTTSDEEGRFAFEELTTGTYNLAVSSPAGEVRQENVEVSADSPEVELRLPSGESVIVRVADADGQAIEDAIVQIERSVNTGSLDLIPGQRRVSVAVDSNGDIINLGAGVTRTGSTDEAGMIRFVGLAEGDYVLTIEKEGYAETKQTVTRSGDDEQLVIVELPRESSLRVLAVDAIGNPIPGANLELERVDADPKDSQSKVTDAWGLAEFNSLTPGEYTLREIASSPSGGFIVFDDPSSAETTPQQEEVLRFALEEGEAGEQQIVLAAKAVPTVLVTRLGVPVPNAGVSIEAKSDGASASYFTIAGFGNSDTSTNAQGRATLPPSDPGTYVIKARAKATNPYTELEVTLGPGAQLFTVELASGGVTGTITGAAGPLVDAQISLNRQRGEGEASTNRGVGIISLAVGDEDGDDDLMTFDFNGADARSNTDGDGRFRFMDVPPGTYTMSIKAKGHSPLTTEAFEVTEGTQVDRGVITLEQGASLGGRIVNIPDDEDGNAPYYTLVRLQDAEGNSVRYGSARSSGNYRFDELEPGTYRLAIDLPNGERRTSDLITVVPGSPTEFDFVL